MEETKLEATLAQLWSIIAKPVIMVVQNNIRASFDYFKKACDGDYGGGCAKYGTTIEKIQHKLKEPLAYYKKACKLYGIDGCKYVRDIEGVLYGKK